MQGAMCSLLCRFLFEHTIACDTMLADNQLLLATAQLLPGLVEAVADTQMGSKFDLPGDSWHTVDYKGTRPVDPWLMSFVVWYSAFTRG